MRLKITLTLLVILLGLLLYIFYIDPRGSEEDGNGRKGSFLSELAVDVDWLQISTPSDGTRATFELENNRWMLTDPFTWPANPFAVERILTQLRFINKKVSFETDRLNQAGSSLQEYGLEPPQMLLEFRSGGKRYEVAIGNPTAVGNHLYIRSIDGKFIHVVDRALLDSLTIERSQLRDPRIFQTSIFEVSSWNLQMRESGNVRRRLSRLDDRWVFETPIRARADTPAVNTALERILSLEIDRIVSSGNADASLFGLQNPYMRIAVEAGNRREVIEIGDVVNPDKPAVRYGKRGNRETVFTFPIDFVDFLANAQTKLRSREIFSLNVEKATAFTINVEGEPALTVQKLEEGGWEIFRRNVQQGISTEDGDREAAEEALLWLSRLKAVPETGFALDAPTSADLEEFGLEVPQYKISVTSSFIEGEEEPLTVPRTETLVVGDRSRDDPMERYVKLRGPEYVYLVYEDVLAQIGQQAYYYSDRDVFNLPRGASIQSIKIVRLKDDKVIYESTGGDPKFQDLSKQILDARADRIRGPNFVSSYEIAGEERPWDYLLEADYERIIGENEQSGILSVYLSDPFGGPLLYGAREENDTFFSLRQPFIDAFQDVVLDRSEKEAGPEPFDLSEPIGEASGEPISDPIDGL